MKRYEVIQGILSLYVHPAYLEIGVSKGDTFHAVQAHAKVAVDPRFRFDIGEAAHEHPESQYHEVTSDNYFGKIALPGDKFDVIYIDGLHTFDQTLRDFTNSLSHLSQGGVIVIDDVIPDSYFASIKELPVVRNLRKRGIVSSRSWMGDVYRLVLFIESYFQSHTYRTVNENHGQLVVWNETRTEVSGATVESVSRAPYELTITNRQAFQFASYATILDELRRHVRLNSRKTAESPSCE